MIAALLSAALQVSAVAPATPLELERGDHICLMGNALAERMQHHGWLETRVQRRFPDLQLSFRNLGFSADELTVRQRTSGFGSPDEHLSRCEADVIFAFFGFNESFQGEAGLPAFEQDLREFVEHTLAADYSGDGPPELVLFSSIAFEDLEDYSLPNGDARNADLRAYRDATRRVAEEQGVRFVDLLDPTFALYAESAEPLTINGIHLSDEGDRRLAQVIDDALFGSKSSLAESAASEQEVRERVLEKNLLWFNRYRATDGYNVYGGRSSLEYDGVTNYTVLQRELEVLDAECALRDRELHALLRGEDPAAVRGDLPPLIPVETNRPGPGPGGLYEFLSGERAIEEMTVADGMRVELFADEEMFPELVNPVQMAWDTRGRLWIACWPTYPHWEPGKPMNDKLLILEDTDGDGRADSCKTFVDDLHNPTGFEFWNGGVLVANAPDLLFLKDTDGDDRADTRERLLHGLSSGDTHHAANSFVLGPDGALYFQEGTFHMSQVESIYGPVRNYNGCVWRFEPRTWRVERYVPYNFANPHGHVFDHWGQDFVTDGTGNQNYYALAFNGFVQHPDKHRGISPFFPQRSRPAGGTEILSSSHFPAENQGNYLIANVIGFQGLFQYEVVDDGAGFGAKEVQPLLYSSDSRFRPVDIEVGPDGAVYLVDWQNPLIGHMQHHLRDPSRDKAHGRVYRVRMKDRELLDPIPIAGHPVMELIDLLREPDDRVRYRTRIELSGRDSEAVTFAAGSRRGAAEQLADRPQTPESEHFLLELLWLQAQHDVFDQPLCEALLSSEVMEVRAASVRLLRSMRHRASEPLELLRAAMDDPAPRVRLEATIALSFFPSQRAAEIALLGLSRDSDRWLEYGLGETLRALEPQWRAALTSGAVFAEEDPRGLEYALARLETSELESVAPSAPLFRELLSRHGLSKQEYVDAAVALSTYEGTSTSAELLAAIDRADARTTGHVDHLLSGLFGAVRLLPADETKSRALATLSTEGRRASTRRLATVARIEADGDLAPAWREAMGSVGALGDLLDALPYLSDPELSAQVFPHVLGLLGGLPNELAAAGGSGETRGRYVRVELPGAQRTLSLAEVEVFSNGQNIAPQGRASQSSDAWGGVAMRGIDGITSGTYAANGMTHTIEGMANPWWELDFGGEVGIDSLRVWNRTENNGQFASRLEGFVLRVLDADRRTVFQSPATPAPNPNVEFEVSSPELRVRRAAVQAVAALGVRRDEAVTALVRYFPDDRVRAAVVGALRGVPSAEWPTSARATLAGELTALFLERPESDFEGPEGRELLAFADELLPLLPEDQALALYLARRERGPQTFVLRPVRDALQYDRDELTVVAGRPVEIVFDNVDLMPHNLVITAPGALARVGLAAESMASEPDAWDRSFIPDTDEVLFHTGLLQPGKSETLSFIAPTEPGDHPFVCTFPGHWIRMNGVMHVVTELPALSSLPVEEEAPAAPTGPTREFVRNWTHADLAKHLPKVDDASIAAGRRALEAATCLSCHQVGEEGGQTGPKLAEVVGKYDRSELLRQILEPSAQILEGYESEVFVTTDGLIVAGRVIEQDEENLYVQDDPYRDDQLVLPIAEIETRKVSELSTMPSGLLTTFKRDEILALLAYLESLAPAEEGER